MSPVAEAEARAAAGVVAQQFPQGEAALKLDRRRSRRGVLFRLLFLMSLVVAVLSLLTLIYTVVNQSFGFVAIESTIPPEELIAELGMPPETELADLDADSRCCYFRSMCPATRAADSSEISASSTIASCSNPRTAGTRCAPGPTPPPVAPLPPRDQANMYQLVLERVVEPNVVGTWSLAASLLDRDESRRRSPRVIRCRARVSLLGFCAFVRSPQNPEPELAGIRTAILGSLWVLAFTILFAFPVGSPPPFIWRSTPRTTASTG